MDEVLAALPRSLGSGWWWTQIFTTLVLPPVSLLLIAGWGVWRWHTRPRLARIACASALIVMWVLSTPSIGFQLMNSLIDSQPIDADALKLFRAEDRPQMIVVLGGGRVKGAIEMGGEDLATRSLYRVRYAARLHRATGLPIAVVGGKPEGGEHSEGELMKSTLENDFGVRVAIVESNSDTTYENAQYGALLLKKEGIERVLLVTDAFHMRRSKDAFKAAGIFVVAAPMGFSTFDPADPKDFLPTPQGLWLSRTALRELGGQVWYQARWHIQRLLPL